MPTFPSHSLLKLCKRLQSILNQYVPYQLNNRAHNNQCQMDIGSSRYSYAIPTASSGHLHFQHRKSQRAFKQITKTDSVIENSVAASILDKDFENRLFSSGAILEGRSLFKEYLKTGMLPTHKRATGRFSQASTVMTQTSAWPDIEQNYRLRFVYSPQGLDRGPLTYSFLQAWLSQQQIKIV